jgi:hypothetical protein
MSKTVTPFNGQMVTFSTSVPFAEVTARLESITYKPISSSELFPVFRGAKSKEDIENGLEKIIGKDDFV